MKIHMTFGVGLTMVVGELIAKHGAGNKEANTLWGSHFISRPNTKGMLASTLKVSFHRRSHFSSFGLPKELLLKGGIFALRAHCALLLDYVPPEEPPSTPLGNALRIR